MKVREILKCDICFKRGSVGDHWSKNWGGGKITITRDGCNGTMEYENICPECREIIVDNFCKVISDIRSVGHRNERP